MWVLFEYGDEKGLDGEGTTHCSSEVDFASAKRTPFVVAAWRCDNDPHEEDDVADDTDDAVRQDAGAKFEVLEDEDEEEEDSSVGQGVGNAVLASNSFPLYANEFEVEKSQKEQVGKDSKVIEYLNKAILIKMNIHGIVKILLVAEMYDTKIAGIVAEGANDQNNQKTEDPTGI